MRTSTQVRFNKAKSDNDQQNWSDAEMYTNLIVYGKLDTATVTFLRDIGRGIATMNQNL